MTDRLELYYINQTRRTPSLREFGQMNDAQIKDADSSPGESSFCTITRKTLRRHRGAEVDRVNPKSSGKDVLVSAGV